MQFFFTFLLWLEYDKIWKDGDGMRARNSRKTDIIYKITAIVLVALTIFILIDCKIRPIVRSAATYQAREIATVLINETISDIIADSDIDTKSLVKLSYTNSGAISSVQTDITAINRLQAMLSIGINEKISRISERSIEIPLGTLTGITALNGRGADLNFKLLPSGYVRTSLSSEFSDAGINQTHHKILLTATATVMALTPGSGTEFELPVSFILGDTVLVGEIPDSFTYVTGDNRGEISKINDYK